MNNKIIKENYWVCNTRDRDNPVCEDRGGGAGIRRYNQYSSREECEQTDKRCQTKYRCDDQTKRCIPFTSLTEIGFPNFEECETQCNSPEITYTCQDNTCTQIQSSTGEFDTPEQCEATGCGEETYTCQNNTCTLVEGRPNGEFADENACNLSGCGEETYTCLDNTCTLVEGRPNGEFADRNACEATGCGEVTYNCSNFVCQEVRGRPNGTFLTRQDCIDSECQKTFNCIGNTCTEVQGPSGIFRTRTNCNDSGCGLTGYVCQNNACTRVEGTTGQFADEQSCTASGCGLTGYVCQNNACVQVQGESGDYATRSDCDASGCGLSGYECQGGFCSEVQGRTGDYPDLQNCLDVSQCGITGYNCSANSCVEVRGNPGDHDTLEACQATGCGLSGFECQGNACTRVEGRNGDFVDRTSCEASGCGLSGYECQANSCSEVQGRTGDYPNLITCQNTGCGQSGYQCENNRCVFLEGQFVDFVDQTACETSGCGEETYNCQNNTCTLVEGRPNGEFANENACNLSGCGKVIYQCQNDSCVEVDRNRNPGADEFDGQANCQSSGCGEETFSCTDNGCVLVAGRPNAPYLTRGSCESECKYACEPLAGVCELNTDGTGYSTMAECTAAGCEAWKWKCGSDGNCFQAADASIYDDKATCESQSCNVICDRINGTCSVDTEQPSCTINAHTCYESIDSCTSDCQPYNWECNQADGTCSQTISGTHVSEEACASACKFNCDDTTGTCVFAGAGGTFDTKLECEASPCQIFDACRGVDCGTGTCQESGLRSYICVCPSCSYHNNSQEPCVENLRTCCQRLRTSDPSVAAVQTGTWDGATNTCNCITGWSGDMCDEMVNSCSVNQYKNYNAPSNGRPFSCQNCASCPAGEVNRVRCSGNGNTDTSECTPNKYYCGTDFCSIDPDGPQDADKDKSDLAICSSNCSRTGTEPVRAAYNQPFCGPRTSVGGTTLSGYTNMGWREYHVPFPFSNVFTNACTFTAPVVYSP